MPRKIWSDEEMILALFLYRFGYEELGLTYSKIADIIGRTPDSILMRFANYLSIEREGTGLHGGGKRVEEFFNEYKHTPKDELRKMVMDFLFSFVQKQK